MKGIRFAENMSVIPLLPPADITSTNTWTAYVDLNLANWCTFLVSYGSVSSGGATCDDMLVQVVCSSLQTTASVDAIDFQYRLSSAIATDSWGTITAGTSDGATIGPAVDSTNLLIDVDPSVVAAYSAVKRFVALEFTPISTSTFVAVTAFLEHKYPGNTIPSSS